jgi:CRP/FNR family cyclic AMP-dependent transcriptional regulator
LRFDSVVAAEVLVSSLSNARITIAVVVTEFGNDGSEAAQVDTHTLANVLGKLQFSESLPDEMLARVAALATIRRFPAAALLFREGAENDQLMIITSGRVALDMQVPRRGEVRILSLEPGDMVAWSALLGGGRMTTSAVALEDTEVVAIRAADALALCQSDPAFGYQLMRRVARALANRLVATRLQLLDLFADTAPLPVSGPD